MAEVKRGQLSHFLQREFQAQEANPAPFKAPSEPARDKYSDNPKRSGKGRYFRGRRVARHQGPDHPGGYVTYSKKDTPHDLQGRVRSGNTVGQQERIMKEADSVYEAAILPGSIYDAPHTSKGRGGKK